MPSHPLAHVHPNPLSLNHKPPIGDGDCVDLVRGSIESLKKAPTREWRPGERVLDSKDLKPGTAIATFLCGFYPQDGETGKHAAIFVRYMGKPNPDGTYNEFMVMEQWKGKLPSTRVLRKKGRVDMKCTGGIYDASNSADAFHVILWRGK